MDKKEYILSKNQVINMCDYIHDHIHLEFDESTKQFKSLCDNTLKWTKEWIANNGLHEKKILDFCQNWGGRHCDCEVILNVPNSYNI